MPRGPHGKRTGRVKPLHRPETTVRNLARQSITSRAAIAGARVLHVQPAAASPVISDLRGAARLAIDAVIGVTDIVEDMHRTIASLAPIFGTAPSGSTQGITGLIYQGVRGVTGLVGVGIDSVLAGFAPLLGAAGDWPGREAVLAALNGVVGDHLTASENPLAITMCLRQHGHPLGLDKDGLRARFGQSGGKLLLLVHGLCMNDLQWEPDGHDHGASAARHLGYTAIYLHYNSGRHISTNGREFTLIMERLIENWPVAISEIVIVGHSMGGLVARSACHYAFLAGHAWLGLLTKLIFLGTPHYGAPLERAGAVFDMLVGASPIAAPLARLGGVRSEGIKDLRHGYVLDEQWERRGATPHGALYGPAALPARVKCFAIAASREKAGSDVSLLGDGLVPVPSALALHREGKPDLPIAEGHRAIVYGLNHFELLSSPDVYRQMADWLAPPRGSSEGAQQA